MAKTFSKETLVSKFKKTEFDQIPEEELLAFVDEIQTIGDIKILDRWREHFKALGTPFAVTYKPSTSFLGKVYRLWIQQKA